MKHTAKFVHNISPSDRDVKDPFDLPEGWNRDRESIVRCLRKVGVLVDSDCPISDYWIEGDDTVVFPKRGGLRKIGSIWWSIVVRKVEEQMPEFGLIDINIHKAENGLWLTTKTAHRDGRPGDDDPRDWGECTEEHELENAIEAAERLAKTILSGGIAGQVTIFVEGSEHQCYGE